MSTQVKPQSKRRFAAVGAAGAVALSAIVLLPATGANAAGTGAQTTEAQIQVVDEAGAPITGAQIELTGTWPELLTSPALDEAEAEARTAQADMQRWYDGQHRPARDASQAAFQKYLAAPTPANLDAWLSKNSAEMAENKKVETQARATTQYKRVTESSMKVSELKAAARTSAHQTRTIITDSNGLATTRVAVGGGIQAQPTAQVIGDDDLITIPYAPSSTSLIVVE
ncbi:hypothetical protein [Leucobacter salsicius]|uniref:hypothetical protein n=1 Tax=Leucobacter salsicius TaxID=664638 RepID=UPI00034A7805|nr:hypothetical protein [Leucobacter salsicius]